MKGNKMNVSLLEVIKSGGREPLSNIDDTEWLLSKQAEFAELVDQAEDFMEEINRLNEVAREEGFEL